MFVSSSLGVDSDKNLTIGGVACSQLAKEFGTPVYVYLKEAIEANCRLYTQTLERFYQGHGLIAYASKAFCCKEMCRIAEKAGLGLDVVSGGELMTALSVGVTAGNICVHGNNKSAQELELAIGNGAGYIVADSTYEILRINKIAQQQNKRQKVLLRVKPGIDAHTHEYIRTGQIDSKFGVALETGEAFDAITANLALENVDLCGVHCHIGSQIFETEPFEEAARRMLSLMEQVRNATGHVLTVLDLGGGFGVRYTKDDDPVDITYGVELICKQVKEQAEKLAFPLPFLILEPGRSIVAEAGVTLYTVGALKDIPGIRKYVAVDGGMTDNPRHIMYKAEYTAYACHNPFEGDQSNVTIVGKCCESGDVLIRDIPMPPLNPGDIVAVASTGAYNYSMASNYNRLPRPPVVMIENKIPKICVRAEDYDDIMRNDV